MILWSGCFSTGWSVRCPQLLPLVKMRHMRPYVSPTPASMCVHAHGGRCEWTCARRRALSLLIVAFCAELLMNHNRPKAWCHILTYDTRPEGRKYNWITQNIRSAVTVIIEISRLRYAKRNFSLNFCGFSYQKIFWSNPTLLNSRKKIYRMRSLTSHTHFYYRRCYFTFGVSDSVVWNVPFDVVKSFSTFSCF